MHQPERDEPVTENETAEAIRNVGYKIAHPQGMSVAEAITLGLSGPDTYHDIASAISAVSFSIDGLTAQFERIADGLTNTPANTEGTTT